MSCQIAKTEYWKIMIWLSDTKCCHLAIHYVLPKDRPGPNLGFRFMKNCIHMSLLGSLAEPIPYKDGYILHSNKQTIPSIYDFWGFKKLILKFLGFQTSNDITDSISMCVEVLKVLRKKAIMALLHKIKVILNNSCGELSL